MADNQFYLKLGASLLLSLGTASIIVAGVEYAGFIAATATLTALVLARSAEKNSLSRGRTDSMKVALAGSIVLYEFIFLLGAASATQKFAGLIALAAVGFSEILQLETTQRLGQSFAPDIGREGRIITLALGFAGYSVNTWLLFYALLLIALFAVYDSLRLIHRLRREI